jgi:hypothetical protein
MTSKLGWVGVLASCVVVSLLAGCGASPAANGSASAPGTPSNLAGNWWITPTTAGSSPTPSPNGMALTLTVTGENISGAVSIVENCNNITATYTSYYSNLITGTIGPNGSFTLVNSTSGAISAANPVILTLQGQTPLTAGGPWTGSYSYTSENTPCATVSGSSTIAASSMPLLNGNFKSTGLLRQGGVVTPATVTVSLQQGGVVGTTLPYEDDVTGTILVQGSSCLTSGAIPSAGGGIIEGTDVQLEFVMIQLSSVYSYPPLCPEVVVAASPSSPSRIRPMEASTIPLPNSSRCCWQRIADSLRE